MAKMLEGILNKVRKPIVKGLVGTMILSSSPRIYSEDSQIIPLYKRYSDKSTAGVVDYDERKTLDKEKDEKEELDNLSFIEKRAIYEDNKLSIRTMSKESGNFISLGKVIKGIDVILGADEAEPEVKWWRVYQGEREINNADRFYSLLDKMNTNTAYNIKIEEEKCYQRQYRENEKWKKIRLPFGLVSAGILGVGLYNLKNKKGSHAATPGVAIAIGGSWLLGSLLIDGSSIIKFRTFFSYEYPDRSWLSDKRPPHKEDSYEFTLDNSRIAIEGYNVELRRRLKLESSYLRKKLGLDE